MQRVYEPTRCVCGITKRAHSLEMVFRAVRLLNWNYGKGDLRSVTRVRAGVYVAVSYLQYGKSTFRVRFVDGRTVHARNHRITLI
jgi:hypothetical protein